MRARIRFSGSIRAVCSSIPLARARGRASSWGCFSPIRRPVRSGGSVWREAWTGYSALRNGRWPALDHRLAADIGGPGASDCPRRRVEGCRPARATGRSSGACRVGRPRAGRADRRGRRRADQGNTGSPANRRRGKRRGCEHWNLCRRGSRALRPTSSDIVTSRPTVSRTCRTRRTRP